MIGRPAFLLSVSCTAAWVIMQYLPNTLLLTLRWIYDPNRRDILNWDIIQRILATSGEGTFSEISIQNILFAPFPAVTCRSVDCRICLQHARQKNTYLFCQEILTVSRGFPESPRHYRRVDMNPVDLIWVLTRLLDIWGLWRKVQSPETLPA